MDSVFNFEEFKPLPNNLEGKEDDRLPETSPLQNIIEICQQLSLESLRLIEEHPSIFPQKQSEHAIALAYLGRLDEAIKAAELIRSSPSKVRAFAEITRISHNSPDSPTAGPVSSALYAARNSVRSTRDFELAELSMSLISELNEDEEEMLRVREKLNNLLNFICDPELYITRRQDILATLVEAEEIEELNPMVRERSNLYGLYAKWGDPSQIEARVRQEVGYYRNRIAPLTVLAKRYIEQNQPDEIERILSEAHLGLEETVTTIGGETRQPDHYSAESDEPRDMNYFRPRIALIRLNILLAAAEACFRLGNNPEAEAYFQRARAIYPETNDNSMGGTFDVAAEAITDYYLITLDVEEAYSKIRQTNKFSRKLPKSASVACQRGKFKFIEISNASWKARPDYRFDTEEATLVGGMAIARAERGEIKDALQIMDQCTFANFTFAEFAIIKTYLCAGDPESAIDFGMKLFVRAHSQPLPLDAELLLQDAPGALAKIGHFAEALNEARVDSDPTNMHLALLNALEESSLEGTLSPILEAIFELVIVLRSSGKLNEIERISLSVESALNNFLASTPLASLESKLPTYLLAIQACLCSSPEELLPFQKRIQELPAHSEERAVLVKAVNEILLEFGQIEQAIQNVDQLSRSLYHILPTLYGRISEYCQSNGDLINFQADSSEKPEPQISTRSELYSIISGWREGEAPEEYLHKIQSLYANLETRCASVGELADFRAILLNNLVISSPAEGRPEYIEASLALLEEFPSAINYEVRWNLADALFVSGYKIDQNEAIELGEWLVKQTRPLLGRQLSSAQRTRLRSGSQYIEIRIPGDQINKSFLSEFENIFIDATVRAPSSMLGTSLLDTKNYTLSMGSWNFAPKDNMHSPHHLDREGKEGEWLSEDDYFYIYPTDTRAILTYSYVKSMKNNPALLAEWCERMVD